MFNLTSINTILTDEVRKIDKALARCYQDIADMQARITEKQTYADELVYRNLAITKAIEDLSKI